MGVSEQHITDDFAAYNGDCIEAMGELPEHFAGLAIFSPPFAELYAYSDDSRDLGNSASYEQFFEHFAFVAKGLRRVMKPGRNVVVHCIDIPAMKERDGFIGIKDFPGDIVRLFTAEGFTYHSRATIWKDPLIEATRTKALGLAHKQLLKDSAMSRQGLPDYLLTFRAPGENAVPVTHGEGLIRYAGADDPEGTGVKRSHNIWRRYASPVWMDIRQTHTLNFREARDPEDEKHICPLQLDVIERCVELWSNPGDVVFSPFMGVGSEVYQAVVCKRRGVGVELKPSYYRQALRNLSRAVIERDKADADDLFSALEPAEVPS